MQNEIKIFDTSLRDGEQTPGVSFNIEEKIEIAKLLDEMGIDIIEAGFPAAGKGEFACVQSISKEIKNASVCALARCVKTDIDIAIQALSNAVKPRLHIFIATSPSHREFKLKMSKEEILQSIEQSISYAASKGIELQFSCEDATRTEKDFLIQAYKTAYINGANTLNIPDTVGYATVVEYGNLVEYIYSELSKVYDDRLPIISVHCHNDLGIATANSLEGIARGARQCECTVNGLGERAGNAAMEEIIMGLRTRKDIYKLEDNIDIKKIYKLSRAMAEYSGIEPAPNKPIVGANVFTHQSGIHQHGVLKNRETYEIMNPKDLGIPSGNLVLSKLSGRHAFKTYAEELGFTLTDSELSTLFTKFKECAEQKKNVCESDVLALLREQSLKTLGSYKLDTYQILSGNKLISTASVSLIHNGEIITKAAWGSGPIEACYAAFNKAGNINCKLQSYQLRAVTEGEDALGEVTVKVKYDDVLMIGKGVSNDILEASCLAYVNAVNRILIKIGRESEE